MVEFTNILKTCELDITDIDWLLINENIFTETYNLENPPSINHPVIKIENEFIILDPSSLLIALKRKITNNLREQQLLDVFQRKFREGVWDSVKKYLSYFEIRKIPFLPERVHEEIPMIDGVFSLDLDKAMIVILLTDDFSEYSDDSMFKFENDDLILARLNEWYEILYYADSTPNEIFILYLSAPFDRFFSVSFPNPLLDEHAIALPVENLKYISLLEGKNDVFLYKFAEAQDELEKTTRLMSFEAMATYGLFKSCDYSFYTSDKIKPTLISIIDDYSIGIKEEVYKKTDLHAVFNPFNNSTVEVIRIHGEDLPLYVASYLPNDIQAVLEKLIVPIWFYTDVNIKVKANRRLVIEFIDTIAYWLYELKNDIVLFFEPLKAYVDHLKIKITFDEKHDWTRFNDEHSKDVNESININLKKPNEIQIRFNYYIISKVNSVDNAAERRILELILMQFAVLGKQFDINVLSKEMISDLIEKYVPLGKKKKFFAIDTSNVPEIDTKDIQECRYIDSIDINMILDQIGEYIDIGKYKIGSTPQEQSSFVNIIVSYLWDRLNKELNTFRGIELLQFLIVQNESLTRDRVLSEIHLPMRLEISSKESVMRDFMEKYKDNNVASLTNRFLIECVVGINPKGIRPVSQREYDRLLSLANQIINWGFTSDIIFNEIANVDLKILPSKRIGTNKDAYEKYLQKFTRKVYTEKSVVLINKFENYWSNKKNIKWEMPEGEKELDKALIEEYGYSLSEYINLVLRLREIANAKNRSIVKISLKELLLNIENDKDFNKEKILTILDRICLLQRNEYFSFPGYGNIQKFEFFPWRYNRSFSYLRRPIIKVFEDGEEQLLYGVRHLVTALQYFISIIYDGKLQNEVKTRRLKSILSKLAEPSGKRFNQKVASLFQHKDFMVKSNVKRLGKIKFLDNGNMEIGDIDVLVIDKFKRKILVIECKDFSIAKTPYELKSEMKNVFDSEKSYIFKHERRVEFVRYNYESILEYFGVSSDKSWKIRSLFVTDSPLLSIYFKRNHNTSIYTLPQLQKEYERL